MTRAREYTRSRSTTSPDKYGRVGILLALSAGWAVSSIAVASLAAAQSVLVILGVGVVEAVLLWRRTWVALGILLPTLPYVIGPLLGASMGDTLWPHPALQSYISATQFMLGSLYFAVCVVVLVGLDRAARLRMSSSASAIAELGATTSVRAFATIGVAILAVQAWAVALQTGTIFGSGPRRSGEDLIWAANSLTTQTLAIVFTVLLVVGALKLNRLPALINILMACALWAPFVLGGGRRIVLYAAVPSLVVLFLLGSRTVRGIVLASSLAGLISFYIIPMVFSGGGEFAASGHGEWSFSGAPFVALISGAFALDDFGASGWPTNIVRMLPDALGGSSVSVLADRLGETRLYPAGTSGSPWVDAWTGEPLTSSLLFASIVLSALAIAILLDRWAPGALVFALGSLVILGRSHAPYLLTTIVVPAVLLAILATIARVDRRGQYSLSDRRRTTRRHYVLAASRNARRDDRRAAK